MGRCGISRGKLKVFRRIKFSESCRTVQITQSLKTWGTWEKKEASGFSLDEHTNGVFQEAIKGDYAEVY